MPSLIPKTKPVPAPLDLREVFESEKCANTLARVVRYIKPAFENCSRRSAADIRREGVITEEFCIEMPTRAAFDSEIELCRAIMDFSEKLIGENVMKDVLNRFIETHTVVYAAGTENKAWLKAGESESFFASPGFILSVSSEGKAETYIVNNVQLWLVYLLKKDAPGVEFKLERLK
jgi:hypothetical protein